MIYLASSWRNPYQPTVLEALRKEGFEVYDFRNPVEGNHGFSACDYPSWTSGTTDGFNLALTLPEPKLALELDMAALQSASVVVMLLPCGKSAHIECGYAMGAGKPVAVLSPSTCRFEPELMYGNADLITDSLITLVCWLEKVECELPPVPGSGAAFSPEDIRVGDVLRVPGFDSVHKPARLRIISDDDPLIAGELLMRLSDARRKWPENYREMEGWTGPFWALERDGKQIAPPVNYKVIDHA